MPATVTPPLLAPPARVALVHDWLTGMRGGEHVLEALCRLFPTAELFTLVHVRGSTSSLIESRRVHESIVSRLPRVRRIYRHCLPLFPFAVEQFDLDAFDLVVSSSHCAAKAVVASGRARHVCYCHSPMRYAWDQFEMYFGAERMGRLPSLVLRRILAAIARWDARTAGRVDRYVANSHHVARRIHRYYNRAAFVVYPPVDTDFFHRDAVAPEPFCLVVSALAPYKRIDLAIGACAAVNVPLKVVGDGPELPRLRRLAGPMVEFLGRRSHEDIRDLYRRAMAVLLPGEEDFGIVPVEAQACGRPVVALGRGGALETVIDGVTGALADAPTTESLARAITRLRGLTIDPQAVRSNAERFGRARFEKEFAACVAEVLNTTATMRPVA